MEKYYKALYRCMMVLAASDRSFDERENDVILAFINKIFKDSATSLSFVKKMKNEMAIALKLKTFLTQDYFDKQLEILSELNDSSREKIINQMKTLVNADGEETYRESYYFEKLVKKLSPLNPFN